MSAMRMTAEERKEAIITLFTHLTHGKTPEEAAEEMGLDSETFEEIRAGMFEVKAREIKGRPTEHVFVQYVIDQTNNLNDLTDTIRAFKDPNNASKQYNALVGAVRARAEILDKIIEKGQEFGIIEKKPEEKIIRGGVVVSNLKDDQLKKMITGALSNLNRLMEQHGEVNIVDVTPGDSHYELPALPPASETVPAQPGRNNKANAAKVHRGRRVVKTGNGQRAQAPVGPPPNDDE